MRTRSLAVALAPVCLAAVACAGSAAPVAKTPEVKDADDQQATCKVAKDPLNPLIVEWPGTSKVALDGASQKGVVVVSYVGCVLKVLTSCQAGGGYEFKAVTPVRDKVSIENETDLYARLPLGVASLKGELATAGRLDLEYVAIGQREAAKPPVSLAGECAGATHYVRSIMVGAYGLDAASRAKASGAVDVAGKGGGVDHSEGVRRIRGSGDVPRCSAQGAKVDDCGAVLQLGLAPLTVSGGGAVKAAGFGAGLGALAVVPTVQEITTLPGGAQSLAAADVDLLNALQAAKRADKASGSPESKAAAWDLLAKYQAGVNPYHELAERRRDEWTRVAEAEARHREQVAKVCAEYKDDSAKLAKLLALDDDVVLPKQKEGYRRELAQVYAPYQAALAECGAPAARAAEARGTDARHGTLRAGGRMWEREPTTATMSWRAADAHCDDLDLAGGGWRLPSPAELKALYDGIPATHGSGWFWSSKPEGNISAWVVHFDSGWTETQGTQNAGHVRCVR